jgi:hypothetical protein
MAQKALQAGEALVGDTSTIKLDNTDPSKATRYVGRLLVTIRDESPTPTMARKLKTLFRKTTSGAGGRSSSKSGEKRSSGSGSGNTADVSGGAAGKPKTKTRKVKSLPPDPLPKGAPLPRDAPGGALVAKAHEHSRWAGAVCEVRVMVLRGAQLPKFRKRDTFKQDVGFSNPVLSVEVMVGPYTVRTKSVEYRSGKGVVQWNELLKERIILPKRPVAAAVAATSAKTAAVIGAQVPDVYIYLCKGNTRKRVCFCRITSESLLRRGAGTPPLEWVSLRADETMGRVPSDQVEI